MSAVPQSTVGYERRFNWALGQEDEDAFVEQVLAGQPEPPRYFGEMKRINRDGPPLLGGLPRPERVAEHRLADLLEDLAVVVDTRSAPDFAAGHVPGTLSIPFNKSFPTWAGALLPYDRDLYLLVEDTRPEGVERVIESLVLIGLDRVRGYFGPEALTLWTSEGRSLGRVPQLSVDGLVDQKPELFILDVRGRSEWESGHLAGATLIPLAELPDRIGEIPNNQPVEVHCEGGGRSAIAASYLRARGIEAQNVSGGFGAWVMAGLPVERS